KAKKSLKMVGKFEDKYSEKSADFFVKYQNGEYKDDEDRIKWAEKYATHMAIMEPLESLKKTADGFYTAKKLAFIQCVGSRDFRFYSFCSGYCCMHSIKEAIIAHEHDSETTSTIFGMDIRAVGKGFEEYKVRGGNNSNITYARGRVAEISQGPNNNPVVTYEDTRERKIKDEAFDLVILATACAPNSGVARLAELLDIEIDNFGFYKTSARQPLDTSREGVFVCGCAHGPMDIPESVAQASSAAARAVQNLTASEAIRQAS
ncbi:MAG: CoB--CoM heterodisulfide reductase iron-sulfur subunit A family protein, partial [Deltaproteobacteria bacterium]|nr:CoB--CoM heterodisulfide reductase iron-sulfur subunit A family protein [Deltaproteobacteria bacterium]